MKHFASSVAVGLLAYVTLLESALAFPRPETIFPRQDDGGVSAFCTPACEVGTCSDFACPGISTRRIKRDWDLPAMSNDSWVDETLSSPHSDLIKRFFRLSNGNRDPSYKGRAIKGYIAEQWETDGDYDNQYQGKVHRYRPNADSRRTPYLFYTGPGAPNADERAMSQQFRFFNDAGTPEASFEIGQAGMKGCTVLALISNRAVWMSHLWEIYSHGRPSQDYLASDNAASFQAFQERSLQFLTSNTPVTNPSQGLYTQGNPKNYIPPDGDSIDASLFNRNNDNTQLVLFVPAADLTDAQLGSVDTSDDSIYRTPRRNRLIIDTVRRHLSTQSDAQGNPVPANIRVDLVPYEPLSNAQLDRRENRGRGQVYFQFDNDADRNGRTAWRLFLEGRVFFGDASP